MFIDVLDGIELTFPRSGVQPIRNTCMATPQLKEVETSSPLGP